MARFLRVSFVNDGAFARARLLDQAAPRTCAAIWDALPLEGEAHQAVYSGSESVLLIPSGIVVPRENATSRVALGDVGYWYTPGGVIYGVPDDLAEIAWFYDRDAVPSMPDGPVLMNIFAQVEGDAEAFYATSRLMRRQGVKRVRVERDA